MIIKINYFKGASMDNEAKKLIEISNNNFMNEKILIVPKLSIGNQLIQHCNNQGYNFFNLRVETISSLANKMVKDIMFSKNISLINTFIAQFITMICLQDLINDKKLMYFNKQEVTPGVINAMYSSISELRLAGYSSKNLETTKFVNSDKGNDLLKLLLSYEKRLEEMNLIDEAAVLKLACDIKSNNLTKYIFAYNKKLSYLENKFMKHAMTYNLYHDVNADFDVENIKISKAYGESNECNGVIRKIKNNSSKFDENTIFYTVKEPYTQYFYNISQKLNIPMTFGSGINIKNTLPGKLYFCILNWMNDNYSVIKINQIISDGSLYISDDNTPSKKDIVKVLRNSNIGWSRVRYVKKLQDSLKIIEDKIITTENQFDLDKLKRQQMKITWIKDFIIEFLEVLPIKDKNNNINFIELAIGLRKIIDKYSNVKSILDKEAKTKILEILNCISKFSNISMEFDKAIIFFKSYIEGCYVNRSTPKPGHIHICNYKDGYWINRQETYIVGLNAVKFPIKLTDGPILLDCERELFNNSMNCIRDHNKSDVKALKQILIKTQGNIYLSYNSYDTLENKKISPTPLLLDIYRRQTNDTNKSYEDFNNEYNVSDNYILEKECDYLDENEYWLSKIINNGPSAIMDSYKNNYSLISKGIEAFNQRHSGEFTKYNGNITVNKSIVDPRINTNIIMSVSNLEKIAKSPFLYLLENILKINSLDEVKYNPNKWLNAIQRGKLLHRIFELFYKEIVKTGEVVNYRKHVNLILDIGTTCIKEFRDLFAVPNDMIYYIESKEILDSCRMFLRCEEQRENKGHPNYLELSFGTNENFDSEGKFEPVKFILPSKMCFHLSGKVDRVDKMFKDNYKIIDYKTGSVYGYSNRFYFKQGKQIQHAIYAMALEELLNIKVSASAYEFLTIKGNGKTFIKNKEFKSITRSDVLNIVDILFDTISSGCFVMSSEKFDNNEAVYKEIIQQNNSLDVVKKIRESCKCKTLLRLKELENYE